MEKENKELKEEVEMLRNIIKLMINNLEYKVKENLEQRKILNLFSKSVVLRLVDIGSDSMSCVGEEFIINNDMLSLEEKKIIKEYLESRIEVVENVGRESR